MAVDIKTIQSIIETGLPGATVAVRDLVGDGDHLEATVVAEQFRGKRLLQQHQMVYGLLKEVLKDQLHALALKTSVKE